MDILRGCQEQDDAMIKAVAVKLAKAMEVVNLMTGYVGEVDKSCASPPDGNTSLPSPNEVSEALGDVAEIAYTLGYDVDRMRMLFRLPAVE